MDNKVEKALTSAPVDADRLFYDLVEEMTTAKRKRVRRQSLKANTVSKLMSYFVCDNKPARTRRWAGIALLCFAQQWDKVKEQLSNDIKQHPVFGSIVLGEAEDLRIVSAAIITTMVVTKGELVSFWPKQDYDAVDMSKFPLDLKSASWFGMLHDFQIDACSQDTNVRVCTSTFCAEKLDLDLQQFNEADRELYCIVGDRFVVTLTPSNGEIPLWIEIPYSKIATINSSPKAIGDFEAESEAIAPVLEVSLVNQVDNCIVNAKKQKTSRIKIFFPNDVALEDARRLLLTAWEERRAPTSQAAETLDASQWPADIKINEPGIPLAAQVTRGERTIEEGSREELKKNKSEGRATVHVMQLEREHSLTELEPGSEPPRTTMPLVRPSTNAGTLVGLLRALSPEPEEPIRLLNTRSSEKPTSASKTNIKYPCASTSNSSSSRKGLLKKANRNKSPAGSRTYAANKMPPMFLWEDKENKDIFDALHSAPLGKGDLRKKGGSASERAAPVAILSKRARGRPRKAKAKVTIDSLDEYKPSQLIDRKPAPDHASIRSIASKNVHLAPPKNTSETEGSSKDTNSQAEFTSTNGNGASDQQRESGEILTHEKQSTANEHDLTCKYSSMTKYREFDAETADYGATRADEINKESIECHIEITPQVIRLANGTREGQPSSEECNGASLQWRDSNRHPSLINERSVRKANFVSFGRAGPKNQGRSSREQNEERSATVHQKVDVPRSPSTAPIRQGSEQIIEITRKKSLTMRDVCGESLAEDPRVTTLDKRSLRDTSGRNSMKRRKVYQDTDDGQLFMPIEYYESEPGASKPLHRASQRRTRVTDDGSPIREDFLMELKELEHRSQKSADLDNSAGVHMSKGLWQRLLQSSERAQEVKRQEWSDFDFSANLNGSSVSAKKGEEKVGDGIDCIQVPDPFSTNKASSQETSVFIRQLASIIDAKQEPIVHLPSAARSDEVDVYSDSSTHINVDLIDERDMVAEAEWEESLEPRHRDILDVLCRISRRFVGHVVDCETAISDVIEDYCKDGHFLLAEFDRKHALQINEHRNSYARGSGAVSKARISRMGPILRSEDDKLRKQVREYLTAFKRAQDAKYQTRKELEVLATLK